MESWDEICNAVNVTFEQTQQIDETAKIVGVSRWEVLATGRWKRQLALSIDQVAPF